MTRSCHGGPRPGGASSNTAVNAAASVPPVHDPWDDHVRYGKHRQSDEAGKNRLVCHRGRRQTQAQRASGKPRRSEIDPNLHRPRASRGENGAVVAKVNEKALYTSENCPAVNWVIRYFTLGDRAEWRNHRKRRERCWSDRGKKPTSTPRVGQRRDGNVRGGAHNDASAPGQSQQLYGP